MELKIKRAISDRKLRANQANAKKSTGPKTKRGKAASCMNALRHGVLSRTLGLNHRIATAECNFPGDGIQPAKSEIAVIRERLARVVRLERDCVAHPDRWGRNARLIVRYERMLTKQLHARIRERAL